MKMKDIDMIKFLVERRLSLNADLAAIHSTEFDITDSFEISVFKNDGGVKYKTNIENMKVSRFELNSMFGILDKNIKNEIENINEQLREAGFEED